jgi:hypothetical protein
MVFGMSPVARETAAPARAREGANRTMQEENRAAGGGPNRASGPAGTGRAGRFGRSEPRIMRANAFPGKHLAPVAKNAHPEAGGPQRPPAALAEAM